MVSLGDPAVLADFMDSQLENRWLSEFIQLEDQDQSCDDFGFFSSTKETNHLVASVC